jgi:hypothetical protein
VNRPGKAGGDAAMMFATTCRPTEVSRGLAPTTASERGATNRSRRYVDIHESYAKLR